MTYPFPPPSSTSRQTALEYLEAKRAHDANTRKMAELERWVVTQPVETFKAKFQEEDHQTRVQLLIFALKLKRVKAAFTLIDLLETPSFQIFTCCVIDAVNVGDIPLLEHLMKKLSPKEKPLTDLKFVTLARDLSEQGKQDIQKVLIEYATPNAGVMAALSLGWASKVSELIPHLEPDNTTFVACIRHGTPEHVQAYLKHALSNDILTSGLPHALHPDKLNYMDLILDRLNKEAQLSSEAQYCLDITYRNAATQNILDVLKKLDPWVSDTICGETCLAAASRGHHACFQFVFERCKKKALDFSENPLVIACRGNHALILQDLIDANLPSTSGVFVHRALFDAVSYGHLESLQVLVSATDLSLWKKEELDALVSPKRLDAFYGVDHQRVVGFIQSRLEQKALDETLPTSQIDGPPPSQAKPRL